MSRSSLMNHSRTMLRLRGRSGRGLVLLPPTEAALFSRCFLKQRVHVMVFEQVLGCCIIFVVSCLLKWNNCARSLPTVAKQFINERFHTRLQAGQMKKYRSTSLPSNQFVCICVCMSVCVHKCACTYAYIYACVSMYVSVYACKYALAIFTANFFS